MDVWKNMKTLYLKPPTKLLEEIVNFEINPFLYKISKEQIVYEFPLQECISLEYLMYAFEHKFIQIFRGQALLIVQMIIMHYIDMRSQKIDHGNLSSANIWIHVGGTGRFSTYARKQEFLKIYFVNYQGECTSEKDEGKSLGLSLNEFLALFDKDSHENWKYFQNKISNCEMIGDYLYVVSSINDFIEKNMDLKKQMLKSNFDYKEVGYLSNRYRQETETKECVKSMFSYEQTEVVGGEEDILFTPLYQYLVQILTNFRMKEIIKDFGKALEINYYSGVGAKDIDDCLNRINPNCQLFFKIVEKKLFNKEQLDKGVQQLKEFIKSFNEEIEQNYKLEIQITKDPQQILLDSWVDWIQTNLVGDPTILLHEKIETLKEDIHKNSRDAYINMYIDLFVKGSEKLVEELL